jgi:hypothetical protein
MVDLYKCSHLILFWETLRGSSKFRVVRFYVLCVTWPHVCVCVCVGGGVGGGTQPSARSVRCGSLDRPAQISVQFAGEVRQEAIVCSNSKQVNHDCDDSKPI